MPQLPPQLLNSLEQLPHFNRETFVAVHEALNRITSLRVNPFKRSGLGFPLADPVPWTNEGFYLNERPSFTLDPLFHAGSYYVQEPGSMFLEHALKSVVPSLAGAKVLDLCGAPGGKSTHLNSLIGEEGLLVSNEFIRSRSSILAQNLSKWGTHNTVVTNNEPEKLGSLGAFFDIMVVDAPCSGSGLFRKQPEAIEEWSEENVKMCRRRQKDILNGALPALKEGGILFYSTCSYSVEENEEIVDWLLAENGMEFLEVPVDPAWGIVQTGKGHRFYPDKTRSEGFFCAVLRKMRADEALRHSKKQGFEALTSSEKEVTGRFVHANNGEVGKWQGRLHFMSEHVTRFLNDTAGKLYLKKAGQFVGEIKGKDLVPSQELAWSIHLHRDVEKVDLTLENALSFLRKTGFPADTGTLGLRLVTYNGLGLGWAKFLQGRINNYLPAELRILM